SRVSRAVPVNPPAFQPVLLDQAEDARVILGPRRHRRAPPGVVPAGVQAEHPAHASKAEFLLVVEHKRVLHPDSLAKYAAAFFKMSRSSVTRRNSDLT